MRSTSASSLSNGNCAPISYKINEVLPNTSDFLVQKRSRVFFFVMPTTTRWDRNLPKIVENPGFFFKNRCVWSLRNLGEISSRHNWSTEIRENQIPFTIKCPIWHVTIYIYVQYIYIYIEWWICIYTVYKYIEHSAWLNDNIPPSWIFVKKGIPHTQTLLSASCGCCEKPRCPDEECQKKTTLWVPIVKSVTIISPEKMDAV